MKKRTINILVLLASLGICLGAIEVTLRLLGMTSPILYRADDRFGYEPLPDQSTTRLGVPIHTNDLGLRDDEDCGAIPDDSEVILVVGDSVTYGGSRIHQADLFTEVLERRLQEDHPGIKVFNAGVNGYSVSQMAGRASALLDRMEVDLVVFYVIRGDFTRPPVTFITEKNFIYPMKRPRFALRAFVRRSFLFLDRRYRVLPASFREWLEPDRPFEVPPFDESVIVETHLRAMEAFAEKWESSGHEREEILIVMAPYADDIRTGNNPNLDLIRRTREMNLRAWDLHADFEEMIGSGDLEEFYWDGVHYTEKGHSLAAEALQKLVPR